MPLAFGDVRSPHLCYLQETGGAKHSTLDVLWRSKKATDTRCHLPYMFRCNAIALDRIRVSQSRAIDPSWARSSLATSRFCRFMASAAVSGFTLALSANTAAAVGHRSCRGTSESAEHSGDAIFPFRRGKGELRRSLDPPLSASSWYL